MFRGFEKVQLLFSPPRTIPRLDQNDTGWRSGSSIVFVGLVIISGRSLLNFYYSEKPRIMNAEAFARIVSETHDYSRYFAHF